MKVLLLYLVTVISYKLCTCEEDCESNFVKGEVYRDLAHHDNARLYLLPSYDIQHTVRNEKFKKIAHHLGFKIKELPDFCTNGLEATKIVARSARNGNVINLKANITGQIDLDSDGVINVGLSFSEECQRTGDGCIEVCRGGHSVKSIDGIDYETCEVTIESMNNFAIVISKRIKRHTILYEILQKFDEHYNESSYPNWREMSETIRTEKANICTDIPGYKTHATAESVTIVEDCRRITDFAKMNIDVAVISKPLKGGTVTNLPVLFYDIPYLLPEHMDKYPNSVVLYNNYNSKLKKALMLFIKKNQWNRIAIISDDSYYSDSFEQELVALFREKEIVYSLKQCLGKSCSFNKALRALKEDQAKIIIANVGEKYAKKLVENASKLGMNSKAKVMWIWRDWPLRRQPEVLKNFGEVFSLIVMPYCKKLDKIDDIYTCKIEVGIKNVNNALQFFPKEEEESTDANNYNKRQRNLANQIRNNIVNQQIVVKLIKFTPQGTNDLKATEIFISLGDKIQIRTNVAYSDLAEPCSSRSYSFSSPCEDTYPLIILVVIGVLLLMLIAIFLVFQKCTRLQTRRRQNYRTLS